VPKCKCDQESVAAIQVSLPCHERDHQEAGNPLAQFGSKLDKKEKKTKKWRGLYSPS
jgi:hypothetical protein